MLSGSVIIGRVLTENYNLYIDKSVDALTVRNFTASYRGTVTTPRHSRGINSVTIKSDTIRSIQTF